MREELIQSIKDFGTNLLDFIGSFFGTMLDVFLYIFDILKTLRFGLTSLLSGLYDLIIQIFNSPIF